MAAPQASRRPGEAEELPEAEEQPPERPAQGRLAQKAPAQPVQSEPELEAAPLQPAQEEVPPPPRQHWMAQGAQPLAAWEYSPDNRYTTVELLFRTSGKSR